MTLLASPLRAVPTGKVILNVDKRNKISLSPSFDHCGKIEACRIQSESETRGVKDSPTKRWQPCRSRASGSFLSYSQTHCPPRYNSKVWFLSAGCGMTSHFFYTNGTAPVPPPDSNRQLNEFANDSNGVFLTSLACYGSVVWEIVLRSPHDWRCIYVPILRNARKERLIKLMLMLCFASTRILPILCAAGVWGFYTQSTIAEPGPTCSCSVLCFWLLSCTFWL